MIINAYWNILKYNVFEDLEKEKDKDLMYQYKLSVLKANGFGDLVDKVPNLSAKFTDTRYDEENLEEAVDVDDVYPISLEDEKREITTRFNNINYLGNVHKTFEHCRTRCKVLDARLRNFVNYDKEHQMCLTDCLNVRTELFNPKKPNNNNIENEKTFVWLA
jgi:hypothetical protein